MMTDRVQPAAARRVHEVRRAHTLPLQTGTCIRMIAALDGEGNGCGKDRRRTELMQEIEAIRVDNGKWGLNRLKKYWHKSFLG